MARKQKTVREESLALNDARMRNKLRDEREALRVKIARLRDLRKGAVNHARHMCARSRVRVNNRAAEIRKTALAEIAKLTQPARNACKQRIAKARQTARNEETALKAEQRAVRSFEQQVFRTALKHKKTAKASRESDADVKRNLEPELHTLWKERAAKTKGSRLKSRTEEFLQWVEEHPEQVATIVTEHSETQVAREIAAHQRAQAKLTKLLQKKGRLSTRELTAAGVSVSDCDSVGLDCHDPSDLHAYLDSVHNSAASEPEPWELTA